MPLENKNLAIFPSPTKISPERKILEIMIAENIDIKTPMPSVNANPLIKDVPNQKRIVAEIIVERLESRIEDQALEKPAETELAIVRPECNSSFSLSKIRILASTAIPIEIINPAIPAAVKVTGNNLNKANIIVIYIERATTAISPGRRYQRIKNNATTKNPIIAALTPAVTASVPSVAPMVCLDKSVMGTGSAPEFNLPTKSFPSVGVKLPDITA